MLTVVTGMKIQLYTDQDYTVLKINGVEYRAKWVNEKVALERCAELARQFLDIDSSLTTVTEVEDPRV